MSRGEVSLQESCFRPVHGKSLCRIDPHCTSCPTGCAQCGIQPLLSEIVSEQTGWTAGTLERPYMGCDCSNGSFHKLDVEMGQ